MARGAVMRDRLDDTVIEAKGGFNEILAISGNAAALDLDATLAKIV